MKNLTQALIVFGLILLSAFMLIEKLVYSAYIAWWIVLIPIWLPIAFVAIAFIMIFSAVYMLAIIDDIKINRKNKIRKKK